MERGWQNGKGIPGGEDFNMPKRLLSWKGRWASVVAPPVFPSTPWIRRRLTTVELLGAMDVPAIRIKRVLPEELERWVKELALPFKVWAKAVDWAMKLAGTKWCKWALEEGPEQETKRAKVCSVEHARARFTAWCGF
jgi:hypothetical protein